MTVKQTKHADLENRLEITALCVIIVSGRRRRLSGCRENQDIRESWRPLGPNICW